MTNLPVYDAVTKALGFSLETIRQDSLNSLRILGGTDPKPMTKRERHKLIQRQNRIIASVKS